PEPWSAGTFRCTTKRDQGHCSKLWRRDNRCRAPLARECERGECDMVIRRCCRGRLLDVFRWCTINAPATCSCIESLALPCLGQLICGPRSFHIVGAE